MKSCYVFENLFKYEFYLQTSISLEHLIMNPAKYKCNFCPILFTFKTNRTRHERNFHAMEKGIPIYMCNDCPFTSLLLSSLEQHFISTHESIANLCEYCNLGFVSNNELNNHMITLHSLPVATSNNTASISKNETIAPNMNVNDIELHESAFNGTLKTFLIPGDDSVDILKFMSKHKEQIQNLILANGFQWPQKVQFSLNLSLQKPSVINDEDLNNPTQNELVDIYDNYLMVPILSDGLADGTFNEMVDRMQSVLHSFASHGSGWVLQQVVRLFIKFGKMNPIRGSSHITLPLKITKSSHLINIRNHDDHDCFNLCFTAAYHLHYRLNLIVGRYEDPAAEKTCPAIYRTSNAKKPIGEFPTPMSFRDIPEFERLNKVRVKVFLYEKGDLVPMLISKNESEDTFSMDLLLLFEPG